MTTTALTTNEVRSADGNGTLGEEVVEWVFSVMLEQRAAGKLLRKGKWMRKDELNAPADKYFDDADVFIFDRTGTETIIAPHIQSSFRRHCS